jgi:hypothetical protein
MGSEAGEKSASSRAAEEGFGEHGCRRGGEYAEFGKEERVLGPMEDWAEDLLAKIAPSFDKGVDYAGVGFAVLAESSCSCSKVMLQQDGCAVVEGVGEWGWRFDPAESKVLLAAGI